MSYCPVREGNPVCSADCAWFFDIMGKCAIYGVAELMLSMQGDVSTIDSTTSTIELEVSSIGSKVRGS